MHRPQHITAYTATHLTVNGTTLQAVDNFVYSAPQMAVWSVACESITEKLVNMCLGPQSTTVSSVYLDNTSHAHSLTAWACSATCASTKICSKSTLLPASQHIPRHQPASAPPLWLPATWQICAAPIIIKENPDKI
ncbi:unnamed protein product [Schistocephalus solidus]|uniref:Uncharacterized protein n=1 Tax=Schistocephalus solidus TaxID=70667 RepID=A0A183SZ35_SCHSO|nr:unnamed protein product [Schistocephalus solidus]